MQGNACAEDLDTRLENGCLNRSRVFENSLAETLEVVNLSLLFFLAPIFCFSLPLPGIFPILSVLFFHMCCSPRANLLLCDGVIITRTKMSFYSFDPRKFGKGY